MNDETSIKPGTSTRHQRGPHLLATSSSQGGEETGSITERRRRLWPLVVVVGLSMGCVAAFVLSGNKAKLSEKEPVATDRIEDLSRQLHSLTQSDLIQFSDGRIWYVRDVQGDDLEVVGWIGDNTRVEHISSILLSGNKFQILRQKDPAWPAARDEYFKQ